MLDALNQDDSGFIMILIQTLYQYAKKIYGN